MKPRNTKNEKAPLQMIAKSIIGAARTISQSECFKIAHAVTKAIIAAGDSYAVTFGASVKLVRETHEVLSKKVAAARIAKRDALLEVKGASEWISGTMHRVYFNDAETFGGLKAVGKKYELDGEAISNNRAFKLRGHKFFFYLITMSFGHTHPDAEFAARVIAGIEAALTEIKGKRIAKRLVKEKLGFENSDGDVMLKPPVPEKFIEVSDARGCVTRYGFDGYYGALAVRFLTSECRISMRQDRLEEFSKLSFYDEIKAMLDEHIESVSALIY